MVVLGAIVFSYCNMMCVKSFELNYRRRNYMTGIDCQARRVT